MTGLQSITNEKDLHRSVDSETENSGSFPEEKQAVYISSSSTINPLSESILLTENQIYDLLATKAIEEQRENVGLRLCMIIMMVFALLVPITLFLTYPSCRDSKQYCAPQFTFQIKDDSAEAVELMSGAREGLRLMSYLAKDLSIGLNDNTNLFASIDYFDIIDTFSTDNIYQLNFNGYCRFNTLSNHSVCSSCYGLDVFSSLVRDAGIQLGDVSNARDSMLLGDSFVTAYDQIIKNVRSIYVSTGKTPQSPAEKSIFDMVQRMVILKKLSFYLSMFGFSVLFISILLLLEVFSVSVSFLPSNSKILEKLQRKLFMNYLLIIGGYFAVIVLSFMIAATEGECISKLDKFSSNVGLAVVRPAIGLWLVWGVVGESSIVCLIIVFIFAKCWII